MMNYMFVLETASYDGRTLFRRSIMEVAGSQAEGHSEASDVVRQHCRLSIFGYFG